MGNYYLYCKKADFAAIADEFHITPMTARILRNRDLCSHEEIQAFLSGTLTSLHDPFLLDSLQIKMDVPMDNTVEVPHND